MSGLSLACSYQRHPLARQVRGRATSLHAAPYLLFKPTRPCHCSRRERHITGDLATGGEHCRYPIRKERRLRQDINAVAGIEALHRALADVQGGGREIWSPKSQVCKWVGASGRGWQEIRLQPCVTESTNDLPMRLNLLCRPSAPTRNPAQLP